MSVLRNRVPANKPPRKPRTPLPRTIRVVEQPTPDSDGWAAVEITIGKQADTYLLRIIPTDFGDGAVGLELEKLDSDLATVEAYRVLLAGAESRCDCLGHTAHGHCKHVSGLT